MDISAIILNRDEGGQEQESSAAKIPAQGKFSTPQGESNELEVHDDYDPNPETQEEMLRLA